MVCGGLQEGGRLSVCGIAGLGASRWGEGAVLQAADGVAGTIRRLWLGGAGGWGVFAGDGGVVGVSLARGGGGAGVRV